MERGRFVETIRHEVWINASRDTVFDAITRREGLDAWWGKAVSAEPKAGTLVEFDHGLGDLLQMRVTELVPGERMEWDCVSDFSDPANPASEWLGTRLRFDLADGDPTGFAPVDHGIKGDRVTVVRFEHSGWADGARWLAYCSYGWALALQSLTNLCEKQEA